MVECITSLDKWFLLPNFAFGSFQSTYIILIMWPKESLTRFRCHIWNYLYLSSLHYCFMKSTRMWEVDRIHILFRATSLCSKHVSNDIAKWHPSCKLTCPMIQRSSNLGSCNNHPWCWEWNFTPTINRLTKKRLAHCEWKESSWHYIRSSLALRSFDICSPISTRYRLV